ncbi:MAG: hypothetical protein HQL69_18890 [Magnetococcales bacterium]|nr:hypothetical protein [Magnetococcales bacterium]
MPTPTTCTQKGNQDSVENLRKKAEKIQVKIAEYKHILNNIFTPKPNYLHELNDIKENILVDIALEEGRYCKSDLNKIDDDISKATQQAKNVSESKRKAAENIQPTINALEKKLLSIQQVLADQSLPQNK